jgi:hypothetical protein
MDFLNAAAVMHRYGRLVEPETRPQQRSMIDWLFNRQPDEPPPTPKGFSTDPSTMVTGMDDVRQEHYPTSKEAEFGREAGAAYGKSWEQYFDDKIAHVYAEGKGAKAHSAELFGTRQTVEQIGEALLKNPGKDVSMAAIRDKNPKLYEQLKDNVARAGLAAQRDPLATLGFDPSQMSYDIRSVLTQPEGVTTFPPKKSIADVTEHPREGVTGINLATQGGHPDDHSTILHEAIHRGYQKLMDRSDEARGLHNALVDEHKAFVKENPGGVALNKDGDQVSTGTEAAVRFIMHQTMGNPEELGLAKVGADRDQQIDEAKEFFKRPKARELLSKIQALAAQEIMKRKPRGPQ